MKNNGKRKAVGTHFWLRRLGAIAVAVACVVLAALTGMAGFVGVGVLLVYRILKQPKTNSQNPQTESAQQEQPSKFWEEGVEKAEAERWEEFLKSDEICPESLPMADGSYRANFYLYEGKPALLPLAPTIFRQERDNGEILPFDEYRLVVITSTRATPTALDYKAAVALITLLLPNADFSVRTLSDGYKYLAINRLSGDELEHLIRAVRDAEKTNPYLAQDKQHSAEDAHGTKPHFGGRHGGLSFWYLGKEQTPCGVFTVTAGKGAVLLADPRKRFKTTREETVRLWRLILKDGDEILGDVNYYHAWWWLTNHADAEKITIDPYENMLVDPLSREELLELKNATDTDYNDDDREYFTLRAECFAEESMNPAADAHGDDDDDDESDTFYTAEEAEEILAELMRRTERQSVIIRTRGLDEGETLAFTQSRFGGLPYWENGADFPKSESGENMVLLAQINFEEVPHIKDFPEKGIVQFFVDGSDPLAPVPGKRQDNWRVVFHKDPSEQKAVSEDTLKRLGVKTLKEIADEGGNAPFTKVFALDFFETTSHINAYCEGRFEKEAKEAAKALNMSVPDEDLNADELFGEEALERFHLYEHSEDCHLIGGYPTFTQGDPRSADDDYDVLLFQMDSEMKGGDWNDGILWGDCGIANFFISRENLQKRDFTNVLYNWDCY